jgi:hypothetical protein
MEDRMQSEPTEISQEKFRMWLRTDGIVQLVWAPRTVTSLTDAIAATSAMTTLTGGRPHPLLVDAHDANSQDRAARNEFARRGDLVSAVALIGVTPLSRMMANFFIAVSKPTSPTRLFDNEASAIAWLREFVA